MRTPDSDQSDSGDPTGGSAEEVSGPADLSLLAEGFATAEDDDAGGSGSEDAFGTGWGTGRADDDESYLVGDEAGDDPLAPDQEDVPAFEFESDHIADTDTDWDLTGDGVIDGHDGEAALGGLRGFDGDPADADGHDHQHDGGFFDG